MKNFKKVLASLGLTTFIFLNRVNVYANAFNDIDKDHSAYTSIQKMYKLGIMLGDLQGNFRPNRYVSKFEAMKIISNFIQNRDIDIYDSKYHNIVSQYNKKYSSWDSSANTSMIFLLENNILKEDELKDFIVIDKDNNEKVRALSKEELALFLSRIENTENNIEQMSFNKIFNDEKDISKDKIKACYYLDSLGVIPSKDNNFYPKNAVTRAELSVILDKFLQYVDISTNQENVKMLEINQNIQTRLVNIQDVFISNDSIQVNVGNETKIYKLDKKVKVYIDEIYSSLSDIKNNTNAEITIQDGFITKIDIKTNLKIENVKNYKEKIENRIYGIIKNVSNDSIGLSYKQLDENGFYSKTKIDIIQLDKDVKITKNIVNISSLEADNLATVILEDNRAKQIIIEDENTMFIGHIVEKDKDKITIKTIDNKIFEIGFIENAKITRNNQKASIASLKIGDKVSLNVKKDKITNISAQGNISKKQGIVKSIKINDRVSIIEIEDKNNTNSIYYIDNCMVDIYSIRLLDRVDLYLDSQEVYAINILDRKHNKNFSGEVIDICKDYITIYSQSLKEKLTTKILIDNNTIFFDYKTLKNVS